MEILSANKFANLYNDKTIFYSHICRLDQVFDKINKVNNEVILICGNGDTPLTDQNLPQNVKYCFAQNALSLNPIVMPIPIGLRNSFPVYIPNQSPLLSGVSFENGEMSAKKLSEIYLNKKNKSPTKFLYSNFGIHSNIMYRQFIKNLCNTIPYITQEEYGGESEEAYDNYLSKILDHEAVLCPIGNGVDTHRLWETLYCNRIPITINANLNKTIGIYANYDNIPPQEDEYLIYSELYSRLPIVILDNYQQLYDKKYLESQIEYQKNKKNNLELLDFNYWKSLILNLEKKLV